MLVELSRFRVKPGKSKRVDEWMAMLNERRDECIQTLAREQMKFEVIFREMIGEDEYLYWVTVQGESGEHVRTSEFEVDRLHVAFHEECIDHDYGMRDAQPMLVLLPDEVAAAMGWTTAATDVAAFQRREIIHRRPSPAEGAA